MWNVTDVILSAGLLISIFINIRKKPHAEKR
jgi:hypothetical protein